MEQEGDDMTNAELAAHIAALRERATRLPWDIDRDIRPRMEWNNHIVSAHADLTIAFMAHTPDDKNERGEANAELIVTLANHAEQIEAALRLNAELVDAAQDVIRISDRKHDAWDRLKALVAKSQEADHGQL
jgi:hypothetical protein